MFKKIMVPVDLRHVERIRHALDVAADLANHYGADVCYVAVTSPEPSELGHTPSEVEQRLKAFGADMARLSGHKTTTHLIVSNDPAIDLDKKLLAAIDDAQADLVVMASHIPNVTDYIWASHGGTIAKRADASVMLVRG